MPSLVAPLGHEFPRHASPHHATDHRASQKFEEEASQHGPEDTGPTHGASTMRDDLATSPQPQQSSTLSTTIGSTLEQAIVAVDEHTRRHPVATPFYNAALAAAVASVNNLAAAVTITIKGRNMWQPLTGRGMTEDEATVGDLHLAAWIQDPHAPAVLIPGGSGHDLDALEHFVLKLEELIKHEDSPAVSWDKQRYEEETNFATGGRPGV